MVFSLQFLCPPSEVKEFINENSRQNLSGGKVQFQTFPISLKNCNMCWPYHKFESLKHNINTTFAKFSKINEITFISTSKLQTF